MKMMTARGETGSKVMMNLCQCMLNSRRLMMSGKLVRLCLFLKDKVMPWPCIKFKFALVAINLI